MAKERSSEFPTDWHQETYLAGLEREVQGYRTRQEELRSAGLSETDPAFVDAVEGEKAALAELKRLGHGQGSASKRPAAKGKKA